MSEFIMRYDPLREALELREQLSSNSRRLGFFFGAGTSMAVGMDGVSSLTKKVEEHIPEDLREHYRNILKQLGEGGTIEGVLNRVRVYREVLTGASGHSFHGIDGPTAEGLERQICLAIYQLISGPPPQGYGPHRTLAQWLRSIERDQPVEIFTINYDLLFERGMESEPAVPYFDGFIGAVDPFFIPESVEAEGIGYTASVYPPRGWIRLWKIHGSIGWRVRYNKETGTKTIIRQPNFDPTEGGELLIYPSREKYLESRKLPYVTYLDRLRRFLGGGEVMFIVLGYSFSDEHLNNLIYEGLRTNTRLHVSAFIYDDSEYQKVLTVAQQYRRLALYGPKGMCIGGVPGEWKEPFRPLKPGEEWPFWDDSNKSFKLGDFTSFTRFLEVTVGMLGQGGVRGGQPPRNPLESGGSESEE